MSSILIFSLFLPPPKGEGDRPQAVVGLPVAQKLIHEFT